MRCWKRPAASAPRCSHRRTLPATGAAPSRTAWCAPPTASPTPGGNSSTAAGTALPSRLTLAARDCRVSSRRRLGGRPFVDLDTRRIRFAKRAEFAGPRRLAAVVGREERVLEEIRVLPQGRALAPARRRGGGRHDLAARMRRRRSGLRAPRRGRAVRHQQLQFGNRRHVVDRAAQIAHPAGREHGLLDLHDPSRVAAVGVEIDRREHTAVRTADREGDVDRAEQLVPVAHFLRVGWLAEAHQRQLRQHDVVRQRFAELAVHAALVGAEHRPGRQIPFTRQRFGLRRTGTQRKPDDSRCQNGHRDQCNDPGQGLLHGQAAVRRV